MTNISTSSPKGAMTATRRFRFAIPFLAMLLAIGGMMIGASQAEAGNYHHKKRSNGVTLQFQFGHGYSTRKIIRPQLRHGFDRRVIYRTPRTIHRVPVVQTCNPHSARKIAAKRFHLRHAHIASVHNNKIVISGRLNGHRQHIAFGHYCQALR